MKNSTIGLTENLIQTLEVEAFLEGIMQFDSVTQKQCLLKAAKALSKPQVIALHGPDRTKAAMTAIREVKPFNQRGG